MNTVPVLDPPRAELIIHFALVASSERKVTAYEGVRGGARRIGGLSLGWNHPMSAIQAPWIHLIGTRAS
jgi:hypothetical protein